MLEQASPSTTKTKARSNQPAQKAFALLQVFYQSNAFVLVLTGLIAYWGVWQLGLAMDDYSNLEDIRNSTVFNLMQSGHFNRFPLWLGLIYPFLVQAPFWLSHTLVIATHITTAILLTSILEKVNFGRIPALLVGILWLVWPSHSETLFWLIASAPVWAMLFVLAGLRFCLAQKYSLGVGLVFLGFLSSEGVILPGALGLLLILNYGRVRWWRQGLYLVSLGGLFGLFQLIRAMINQGQQLTPYKTGLGKFWQNIGHLSFMQIGQASSADTAALWNSTPPDKYNYVGLTLGYNVIILAGLIAVILCFLTFARSTQSFPLQSTSLKFVFGWVAVAIVGWLASVAIFTVIEGNNMQTRYTYSMTIFFCIFIVLILSQIANRVGKMAGAEQGALFGRAFLGWGIFALLIWSLFLSWSSIYSNWYPAKQVNDKMIADLKTTGRETGINQIFVVDSVHAVGNAFTLSAPWAYYSVGRMFLDKNALVEMVNLPYDFNIGRLKLDQKFTERPCIFLTWQGGQRVLASQLAVPPLNLQMDCATGWVSQLKPTTAPRIVFQGSTAAEDLEKLGIKP